jgi:uncharacterized protein YqgC (DUF456 family)
MPEWCAIMLEWLGSGLMTLFIVVLCLGGILLSCLLMSGTWVVLLAAVLAMLTRGADSFPGWGVLTLFLILCLLVELGEYAAGMVGVSRRGGSRLAGWAALGGGLVGLVLGSAIPIPLVGSLLGMLAGSFGMVYLVESRRLAHAQALHIAVGTLWARVAVLGGKVLVTLVMTVVLWLGMAIS